jgi:hypothetical protein
MSYAYVTINLDDVDTSDLIDELENRYLDKDEQESLLDLVKVDLERSEKLKLLLKIVDKYSLQELSEMFKEDCTTPIPKNQLALPL